MSVSVRIDDVLVEQARSAAKAEFRIEPLSRGQLPRRDTDNGLSQRRYIL